ncbi:MAG: hypothetical protein GX256_06460, partial [Fretibacterium sp.]|nr:hypothetical protein [Fretibacterium sp.]
MKKVGKMGKKYWGVFLSAVMGLCFILGGTAAAAPAPLPVWEAPHMVGHLEDVGTTVRQLADSFFMETILEKVQTQSVLLGWLREFPIESVTWVRGLLEETEEFAQGDERYFQGVVRFGDDPDVQELLKKLSEGVEEAEDEMAYALLKVPEDEELRGSLELSFSNADEEGLYDMELCTYGWLREFVGDWDWEFKVSVGRDGNDFVLLYGGSADDLARAKAALEGSEGRLEIARSSELGSFVRLNDDVDSTWAKELFKDLNFDLQLPGFLELSFGVKAEKIALALRHNLYDVAFGGAEKPGSAASLQDPGLKFGGGTPWLVGIGSVLLEKGPLLKFLSFISGEEEEELVESLNSSLGVSVETLLGAFRAFGLALGGDTALFGETAPGLGGYAFVSGEAESMRALLPLIKGVFDSLGNLEEIDREGWDTFWSLESDLQVDGALPLPLFAGVKDGVLMMGILDEKSLEKEPELKQQDDGAGRVLLVEADFATLTSGLLAFLNSPALKRGPQMAELMGFNWLEVLNLWANL